MHIHDQKSVFKNTTLALHCLSSTDLLLTAAKRDAASFGCVRLEWPLAAWNFRCVKLMRPPADVPRRWQACSSLLRTRGSPQSWQTGRWRSPASLFLARSPSQCVQSCRGDTRGQRADVTRCSNLRNAFVNSEYMIPAVEIAWGERKNHSLRRLLDVYLLWQLTRKGQKEAAVPACPFY